MAIRRSNDAVLKDLSSYNKVYQNSTYVDRRKDQYETLVRNYYSLISDFYEHMWHRIFHLANRFHCETFAQSLQRHESYLALKIQLKPGNKVLDLGCGIGGPLRCIAYLTGAHVTGITIRSYQVQRAKTIGIPANCQFIEGDFMKLPFENNTFDHIYTVKAVCHAPDKAKCFAEVFRVLKPGGSFVGYDWCITDKYDDKNREHIGIKHLIEVTSASCQLKSTDELTLDLKSVCFTIEENRIIPEGDIPLIHSADNYASFFSFHSIYTKWYGA
ncbi:unnamed protein product [Rotaria sp. Silwood1]|nr:unnamed protein product [Rotaria sp. Silwood1]CAF1684656.1 unnamed protein product [Rotaria sp. Silwood1]CAF3541141.1 unnamed protein product [Rotaria sp. Silwood1]CAF3586044.1 unnamed protein product [Rotaria sp. Silwood1]CAF3601864.1 unnamed protein product [Rotaria sp. Silwood1]